MNWINSCFYDHIQYFRGTRISLYAMRRQKNWRVLLCLWNALRASQSRWNMFTSVISPLQLSIFFLLKLDFWVVYTLVVRWSSAVPFFFFNYVPLLVHLNWHQQGLIYNRGTIWSDLSRVWFLIVLRGKSGYCQGWGRVLSLAKCCMQLN